MKRTRSTLKANSTKQEHKDDPGKDETEEKAEDIKHQFQAVQAKNSQNQKLSNTLQTDRREALDTAESATLSASSLGDVQSSDQTQKSKLNFKSLKDRNKANNEDFKPNTLPKTNKPRAVVDLKMMVEELKQLEDPPLTAWEKQICSNRLPFSFFDSPCEQLAQNLLGKILVRCLENGTILKGRIVETEGYLGVIDKASHTYQNKVTARNMPMYMPPGTIYVYMTYGMYHCFNISSQESGAHVLIKAVEPILGLDYMELLRNMQFERTKEKRIVKKARRIKPYELCNGPSKICTAFFIEEDNFNEKKIYECNDLWVEIDPYIKYTTIVAAQPNDSEPSKQKIWRYYVLGSNSVTHRDKSVGKILGEGCAVLIRAVEPLEGIETMTTQRTSKGTSTVPKKPLRIFNTHELCNGPSKLCMAFQLRKIHSKHSMCSWKGLWIERGDVDEEIAIVKCPRIGIDNYGAEWSNKPLRYYVHGSKSVSKRNKKAELLLGLN